MVQCVQVKLDKVSYFKHSGSCTLLLEAKSQPLADLHSTLQEVFPEFNDTTLDQHGNFRGFNPHLSLGQCKHDEVEQKAQVKIPWFLKSQSKSLYNLLKESMYMQWISFQSSLIFWHWYEFNSLKSVYQRTRTDCCANCWLFFSLFIHLIWFWLNYWVKAFESVDSIGPKIQTCMMSNFSQVLIHLQDFQEQIDSLTFEVKGVEIISREVFSHALA